jgi:hypothetical protein
MLAAAAIKLGTQTDINVEEYLAMAAEAADGDHVALLVSLQQKGCNRGRKSGTLSRAWNLGMRVSIECSTTNTSKQSMSR